MNSKIRKKTARLAVKNLDHGIYQIDAFYLNREGFASCYLIADSKSRELAVVETNTNRAVPLIMEAIAGLGFEKNQVKKVIVTHIHLDHAGGAGTLMKHLGKAELILHSRAVRHMVNPEKLVSSVKEVYGEEKYREIYGDIIPVPKDRTRVVKEGDTLSIGDRELLFLDTPGHARHHLVAFDPQSGSVFAGDAFGIAYPRFSHDGSRLIFPSTSPTQFDPHRALETYQKIADLEPSRILLTHFGSLEDIPTGLAELTDSINYSTHRARQRYREGLKEDDLIDRLRADIRDHYEEKMIKMRGTGLTDEEKDFLFLDIDLNAKGVAHYITRNHP